MSNSLNLFRALLITLSFVALTQGCSSAPPFPKDMRITAPSNDLPSEIAGYSGIWEGNWGAQAFKVVIESIGTTGAKGIYIMGRMAYHLRSSSVGPGWVAEDRRDG